MASSARTCKYFNSYKKGEFCLPDSWIVVRLDGKQFTKFTDIHGFTKPNDVRALELMNKAAASVVGDLKDVCLAFGQSDEYSFVFRKDTKLFDRCRDSVSTVVNSLFSSAYVYYWSDYFGYTRLLYPPSFDCRVVVYPTDSNLRDYLSWRQADVHVNNLYNTAFWALVKKGKLDRREAQKKLSGTVSREKNDILFEQFGINYNNEPIMFRKGTTLVRKLVPKETSGEKREHILQLNCDIINDAFWIENSEILNSKTVPVLPLPVDAVMMENIRIGFREAHILLDIEGTTSSIAFVKDVLFPHIRKNLGNYVTKEWENEEFRSHIRLLKKQCEEDLANQIEGVEPIAEGDREKESVIAYILLLMDQSRKVTALKTIEGYILENVFRSGELKGHVYTDVEPSLKNWKEKGKKLHIYSSGSVKAQKLFFGYSTNGDILHLFSNHFDTTIGSKVEPESYTKISEAVGCVTSDILFVTDAIKEAEAASAAGCRVIISVRPGNETIPEEIKIKYRTIRSFEQLRPES